MDNSAKLTPFSRLLGLLKPDQREIRNVYIYAIFAGLLSLSLPLGIQAIVNLIQGGQINTSWIVLVIFVVLGVAFNGILQIFQLRITENLQQRIFTRAAFEFAYRIPRIKMEELYRHYAPELMNRFFDIVSVQKGLSKMLIDFSTAVLHILFGLLLLSFYHPFFILFGIFLVLLVYLIIRLTAARGLRTSLNESKHKYKLAYWLEEMARTSSTFKLAGNTDLPTQRTDYHVHEYLKSRESHFKVLVQQFSLMVFFKVMVALGLLAIGGVLVMEQLMNIGQFVAAEIIVLLIINAVEKLIMSTETIYDVITSLEKISQVTELELERAGGIDLKKECKQDGLKLEMSEVDFYFPGGDRPILKDLNLTLNPGERALVIGKNGAGKSSLLQVLAALYDVKSGNLSYEGIPINNLEMASVRAMIGDCLSQEQLFEGTLYENITMGRKAATFENVQWAVNALGLGEFIRSLPQGYDTLLDPEGRKFPRSTIQKLLIARSVVDRPKLLLFENSFEALDEADRMKVIDFLTDKENQWSLLAASSDEYLASKVDKILLMEKGTIVREADYEQMKPYFKLND